MKNYGFSLELEKAHQSPSDYIYGALSPDCIADVPEEERIQYLPVGEVQIGAEDMMDCATRGPINIAETKFNWLYRNNKLSPSNKQWLESKGYVVEGSVRFSDAFIAIKSGTTRQGNSMIAPLHAIHTFGLIPKDSLPLKEWMTFDDYHNPKRVTEYMDAIGEEFKCRFPMFYERVLRPHFAEVYKDDMLILAGHAWSTPVDGEYPRTTAPLNHIFMGIKKPLHTIFDNYVDPTDGDFIKKLAQNYELYDEGYRLFITQVEPKPAIMPLPRFSFLARLWQFIQMFLNPKTT